MSKRHFAPRDITSNRFPRVLSSLSLLLLCSLNFLACSSLGSIPPEVAVVDLRFENVTLLETTALFSIRIDNENPYPLEVSGASHRIYLNENYVGKGLDDTGFTVPKLSSVKKDIRVHISNWSLLTNAPSMAEEETLSYRIDSTLYSDKLGFGRTRVSDTGTLDLKKITQAGTRNFAPRSSENLESKEGKEPTN